MALNWFKNLDVVYGLPGLVAVDGINHTMEALDLWRAMMLEDDEALAELASIGLRFRDRGDGLELSPIDINHTWTDEEMDANHIAMSKMPRIRMLADDAGLMFINCERMPNRKRASRYLSIMRFLRLAR